MLNLVCSLLLVTQSGYREWITIKGTFVKDRGDYYYVDFGPELRRRKLRKYFTSDVIKVPDNWCLHEN